MSSSHHAIIQRLIAARDWVGLVSHALAHSHWPAMAAAASVVQTQMPSSNPVKADIVLILERAGSGQWSDLPSLHDGMERFLAKHEQAVLAAIGHYMNATGKALAPTRSNSTDHSLTKRLAAAGFGEKIAVLLANPSLQAKFVCLEADLCRELGELEAAIAANQKAISLYSRPFQESPELVADLILSAQANLGNCLQEAGRLKDAGSAYRAAIDFARTSPTSNQQGRSSFAALLQFLLGMTLRQSGVCDEAEGYLTMAEDALRRLAASGAVNWREIHAQCLAELGEVHLHFYAGKLAEHFFEESLAAYQELDKIMPEIAKPQVVRLTKAMGLAHLINGDVILATQRLEEAKRLIHLSALHRTKPGLELLVEMHRDLGMAHLYIHDSTRAQHELERCLELLAGFSSARRSLFASVEAHALTDLARLNRSLGHYQKALMYLSGAITLINRSPNLSGAAADSRLFRARMEVGLCEMELGRLVSAEEAFREAENSCGTQSGTVQLERRVELNKCFGVLYLRARRWPEAHSHLTAAIESARRCPGERGRILAAHECECLVSLATIAILADDLDEARNLSEMAVQIAGQLAARWPIVMESELVRALSMLGELLLLRGDTEAARTRLEEALAILRRLRAEKPDQWLTKTANVLYRLALCSWSENSLNAALEDIREAVSLHREIAARAGSVHVGLAECLAFQGRVHQKMLDFPAAEDALMSAARLFESLNASPAALGCEARYKVHLDLAALALNASLPGRPPDLEAAANHLRKGCDCALEFRRVVPSRRARRLALERTYGAFELLVRICVDLAGSPAASVPSSTRWLKEAVSAAEALRGNQLLDQVLMFQQEPAVALASTRKALTQSCNPSSQHPASNQTAGFTLARLDYGSGEKTAKSEADATIPATMPPAAERVEGTPNTRSEDHRIRGGWEFTPVRAEEMLGLLPEDKPTAFVQFLLGIDRSFAFILTRSSPEIRAVELHGLTARAAWQLADDWAEGYEKSLASLQGAENQREHVQWLAFERFCKDWNSAATFILARLSELAMNPVLKALPPGIARLVLCPNQQLRLFPLHACLNASGCPLAETLEIAYTPSFSLLHLRANGTPPPDGGALLVSNPNSDLLFAEAEGKAVASCVDPLLRVCQLRGAQASRTAILAALQRARLFHYSGHTVFDSKTPLRSAFKLGAEHLRLEDILRNGHLPCLRLAVLNGCESGRVNSDLLDDSNGFASTFMIAGSPCVISSLWTIPDMSPALLMSRFYEAWSAGSTPCAALHTAQRWLMQLEAGPALDSYVEQCASHLEDSQLSKRCVQQVRRCSEIFGDRPFSSLLHWAPFICSGLGFDRTGQLTCNR